MIGRTWLDADQARAGDALGLSKADRLKLRDVGQGEFYAFGPALGQPGVIRFRSDQVGTTHPRPGQRHLLTAPAPSHTGGGFNNYLGALRSRGLIKGDGDSLRITETGIRELGSWEPLPVGAGLIDYWRSRLGKAERLILEMLT